MYIGGFALPSQKFFHMPYISVALVAGLVPASASSQRAPRMHASSTVEKYPKTAAASVSCAAATQLSLPHTAALRKAGVHTAGHIVPQPPGRKNTVRSVRWHIWPTSQVAAAGREKIVSGVTPTYASRPRTSVGSVV